MTSAGPFLLRAILSAPDDDTPRLVYADWLEENGDGDRAEFVRVQCELARGCAICEYGDYLSNRTKPGRCPWCGSEKRRMDAMLAAHQREWFHIDGLSSPGFGESEPLCWWPAGDSRGEPKPRIEGTHTRGFVSSLTTTCAAFMQHAAAIFASQPVTRVVLSDREPRLFSEYDSNFYQGNLTTHLWVTYDSAREGEQRGQDDSAAIDKKLRKYLGGKLWDCGPAPQYDLIGHYFPTPDLARAALSAACVAYGRELANLPPLPLTPVSEPATATG